MAAASNSPAPRDLGGPDAATRRDDDQEALPTASSVVTKKRYFHRVVLTCVHADKDYLAEVYAKAGLSRRDGRWQPHHDRSENSYKTVGNADDVDSIVPADWGHLPAITQAASNRGVELLSIARERTIWDEDVDRDDLLEQRTEQGAVTEPIMYGPGGQSITSRAELVALLNGDLQPPNSDGDQLWIVPSLIFKCEFQGQGEYGQELCCGRCESQTEHVFIDHERSHPELQELVPVWMCSDCKCCRNGPEPGQEAGS
jgi:hypothetical protein